MYSIAVASSDTPTTPTSSTLSTSGAMAYFNANPDLQAYYYANSDSIRMNEAQWAAQHYTEYGQYENRDLGFADGGILSGPTSGYQVDATFHGPEAIIPLDRLDHSGLINEIKALREENKAHFISLIKLNQKVAKYTQLIEKWDTVGMPAEATV